MLLKIKGCNKKFSVNNSEITILKNINLEIKEREFVSIVGHSGCGKSTLLKLIVGLDDDYEGEIVYKQKKIKEPIDEISMIFQDHRLLPWLTVEQNITFGLEGSKAEKKSLVQQYIKLVKLEGFATAYPSQLSGGMAQRTAIARALITQPDLLLLDEPLGALDALTKINMQNEILGIHQQNQTTMILVTHDIEEAIYLGDKILVMSARPGEIKKIITIDLPYPRDRNSNDFLYYKKMIYEQFFTEVPVKKDFEI